MSKIKSIEQALAIFEESAEIHGDATDDGDYRLGNKHHTKLKKAVAYLKAENKIDYLYQLISNHNPSVKLWAATHLLPYYESDALTAITEVENGSGIVSFSAKMTKQEWKKGNLTSLSD